MSNLSPRALDAIRTLVADLVAGNYAAIERDGRIGRVTSAELQTRIAEYGRTLVAPPPNAIDGLDGIKIGSSGATAPEFAVDVPLWTAEEGQSDLTLFLTVVEAGDRAIVSIDDLRVP